MGLKAVTYYEMVCDHVDTDGKACGTKTGDIGDYLSGLQGQLIGLAKKALYRKALACTEWSAAWCDIHGTCSCGEDREYGEWHNDCPLHGEQSEHAEKGETED